MIEVRRRAGRGLGGRAEHETIGMKVQMNYEAGKPWHTQRMRDRKAVRDWAREHRATRAKGIARARRGRRTPTCGWSDAATIALLVACAAWLCS